LLLLKQQQKFAAKYSTKVECGESIKLILIKKID